MNQPDIENIYALSPMQEGMLFHSLYSPESGIYYRQFQCTVNGRLETAHFRRAWEFVAQRHAILRTSFYWEKLDHPLQAVHRNIAVPLSVEDWREMAPEAREGRLAELLSESRNQGFALEQAPLWRLFLLQIDDLKHWFIWAYHHLILDGWSKTLLYREILARYDELQGGRKRQWVSAPPYSDYIGWIQRQDHAAAEDHWRANLEDFQAPTPLPLARGGVGFSTPEGEYDERQVIIDIESTSGLTAFARRSRITLGTVLQGAYALLLARLTGESDIVFGVTVSGRPGGLPRVEEMAGVFINTLPMRVRVAGEEPLVPWLQRIQAQQAELRGYEFCSLAQVQNYSSVPPGMPLFETILDFANYPSDVQQQDNRQQFSVDDARLVERNNYPMSLVALPGNTIALRIAYDSNRFDGKAIERMLAYLQTLLGDMASRPQSSLSGLRVLPDRQESLLIEQWSRGANVPVEERGLSEAFESAVESFPEAVAVSADDGDVTYRCLNQRANQLAHHLHSMGVGPESRVAVCMQRSTDLLVALLAVLKARGVFLPVDPDLPFDRFEFLMEDARPSVLIASEDLVSDILPSVAPVQVVCPELNREAIRKRSCTNPVFKPDPASLAYCVYTSGSTGHPKGVCVTHSAGLSHMLEMRRAFEVTPEDRVLQFASLSFDVALEQIFTALLSGATLVPRSPEIWNPRDFFLQAARRAISVANPPAAYWHQLALGVGQNPNPELRLMISGGETMFPDAVRKWLAGPAAATPLLNAYGPTEAIITTSVYHLPASGVEGARVPVGRPLRGRSYYILDAAGHPVPMGVVGDLCIGGALLARGYWDRADLTAERFVPDPFSSAPGGRLYLTGDLATFAGGNVEIRGRNDHQVKIRGFRVELGEIEAVLREFPGVRQAAVIAHGDSPDNRRLCAYTASEDGPISVREMRAFVSARLPEHMIPASITVLRQLPMTVTGKIDRRGLPAPDFGVDLDEGSFVEPRGEIEQNVAAIWCELLGCERVGAETNFFEAGGHSLLITQMASRLRRSFDVDIPLRTLFDVPTIRGISDEIQKSDRTAGAAVSVATQD